MNKTYVHRPSILSVETVVETESLKSQESVSFSFLQQYDGDKKRKDKRYKKT